jgi:CDP-diacylglycerol--glycerol-3-phosphate 3-phosphatidyltransferase
MPSIYDLKPKFQKLLTPLLLLLVKLKVTPNQITLLALFLSFVAGVCLCFGSEHKWVLLLIPFILFVRMALNALDGMLARNYNLSSKLGEVLNEVGDVLADAFLYLPLLCLFESRLVCILIVTFVFFATLTEFCGLLAKTITRQRAYHGPMGKSDRAFLIGAFCLILYFLPIGIVTSSIIFFLANLLLMLSCFNRLKAALNKN